MAETYSFTLRLNRVVGDDELDAIFEAGLDDAAVEGDLVHVDREAPTPLEAVWSAACQVSTAGENLHAERVVWDELVSLREIAQRTERTYESVRLLAEGRRGPGGFPEPEVDTQTGRVWAWSTIAEWFEKHDLLGRPAGIDAALVHDLRVADLLVRIAAVTAAADPDERARITSVLREVA